MGATGTDTGIVGLTEEKVLDDGGYIEVAVE
jgi:hypothetical protein